MAPTNGSKKSIYDIAAAKDVKTDRTRWRLTVKDGQQRWHYLSTDAEAQAWPQTVADKYHLNLATNNPTLPEPKTYIDVARNGLAFFETLQLSEGNWGCEYGGPLFLMPGLVVTWYVTGFEIPAEHKTEIRNYLYARQNRSDGGWGLHIEGESTVFGTAMNYTVMRLVGADPEDPRMVKARECLRSLGGAVQGPHWAKFWLSVLGVCDWKAVNPVPPELWLLPDWVPIAPWRWWIHMRQVFLPMSYIWSQKYSHPLTPLTRALRDELYIQDYDQIDFAYHRNSICPRDNYYPKTLLLKVINAALVNIWNPFIGPFLKKRADDWAYKLIQMEDVNTAYADLAPVNGPMNTVACMLREGRDSWVVKEHLAMMPDYLWMKDEGLLANGTNGVQTWDTAFGIQCVISSGEATNPRWRPMLTQALAFLDKQQIREEVADMHACYRHTRKGAWAFSTRLQGYTVSDCTAEAGKSVMLLQSIPGFPQLVGAQRLHDAADVVLSLQNSSGGFASYEKRRGNATLMEWLNAAEVFGNIMVEYDYPECTTACVTFLSLFQKHFPAYRAAEIALCLERAVAWVRSNQRPDGSWYGSWGICFTYATMFALESLASVGERYDNSARVRRACDFLLAKQNRDGGWGESYRACEIHEWVDHPDGSQVVNTAWAVIGLIEAGYPDDEPLTRALDLLKRRQQPDGQWLQEGIEGVFNKSCMISYPNYKFVFPIKALGMFAMRQKGELGH